MVRTHVAIMSVALVALSSAAEAQHTDHAQHTQHARADAPAATATEGNSIFASLRAVITLLESDPATDWRRVSIESLRQHLIDMQDVIANSTIAQTDVALGIRADVTGSGRTAGAIRRMAGAHSQQPDLLAGVTMTVTDIPDGVRVTVTAADQRTAEKVQALGFAGLLVLGDHHASHHLAIARGDHPHSH